MCQWGHVVYPGPHNKCITTPLILMFLLYNITTIKLNDHQNLLPHFPVFPLTYMYMCVGMNVMSVMSVVVCRVSLSLV